MFVVVQHVFQNAYRSYSYHGALWSSMSLDVLDGIGRVCLIRMTLQQKGVSHVGKR